MIWIQIAILLFLEGAQISKRSFLTKYAQILFWISVAVSFLNSAYFSCLQYKIWENGPLGVFLLPPHRGVGYFIEYSAWKFWAPAIISLIIALVFLSVFGLLNRKYQEKFLEKEEPYLAGIGIILTGYPGFLVYGLLFFGLFFMANLFNSFKKGRSYRISPYYFWIPAAVIAILICELWLSRLPWWNSLII